MNLVKFAKLTLATLATYEVVRTNAPARLPVGVAKAATVATAVAVSRLPDEYLDPFAAVGILTVANKWLDVDSFTPWGENIIARAKSRWRTWRDKSGDIPAPPATSLLSVFPTMPDASGGIVPKF